MAINNTVTLIGNLGAEAQLIEENTATSFVAIRLATTDSYKDSKTGQWKKKQTIWHDVVAFNPMLIELLQDLKTGARIRVEGALSYRPYKVMVDDKEVEKKEASIIAKRVEMAPLPKNHKGETVEAEEASIEREFNPETGEVLEYQ